jgi:hypothetical protein
MLRSPHASARIAMISGIAEILNLSVAKLSLGIHEQDLAGNLVVLSDRKTWRSANRPFNEE